MEGKEINLEEIKKEYTKIFEKFYKCVKLNLTEESEEVQNIVLDLYNTIDKYYGCDIKILEFFASMYINEPEYIKVLNKYDERLPKYINNSINIFCNKRK